MLKMLAFFFLISGALQAQKGVTTESQQVKKIQSLVKKMTIEEKVGLLHSNSKFLR